MKPRLYLFYSDRMKNTLQVLILKYDLCGWGCVYEKNNHILPLSGGGYRKQSGLFVTDVAILNSTCKFPERRCVWHVKKIGRSIIRQNWHSKNIPTRWGWWTKGTLLNLVRINEWIFELQLKKFRLGSLEAKEEEENKGRKENSVPKTETPVYPK